MLLRFFHKINWSLPKGSETTLIGSPRLLIQNISSYWWLLPSSASSPECSTQPSPGKNSVAKKFFSFRKALPHSSSENGTSYSVSINDFKCVPSCRRWQYPVIRLLINQEAIRKRVAKGFCVTRDGPKICRMTRDWTQIIRVTRDRTSQLDAWFSILQVRDAWFTKLTN